MLSATQGFSLRPEQSLVKKEDQQALEVVKSLTGAVSVWISPEANPRTRIHLLVVYVRGEENMETQIRELGNETEKGRKSKMVCYQASNHLATGS